MKRIMSGILGRAFNAWRAQAVQLADLKARLHIFVARLANAAAARAFSSWKDCVVQNARLRYVP